MKNHERGALYLVCPVHGVDRTSGHHQKALDDWIEKNSIKPGTEPEQKPEPIPEHPEPAPEPENHPKPAGKPGAPEPEPEPEPKKPGFWRAAAAQFSGWWEAQP
jgi:hypothetical protein